LIISKSYLRDVKGCALRKRIWYKALDKLERGIIDLTINIVECAKSKILVQEITKILAKLESAMRSRFTRHYETFGLEKLRNVVETARGFGSKVCSEWYTQSFALLLTLNDYNNHVGWKQTHG